MKYILILLFSGSFLAAIGQLQGTVYRDLNQNGKKDVDDTGIPSVTVSDGYNLVKTDSKGNFELPPNEKGRFIFATIPSGYKASTQFYIKIDSATAHYAIGLLKDESQHSDELDFIQITDTETGLYGTWVDNIKHYAKNQQIPLIMHTGDICYEDGMKFHARHLNANILGTTINYAVGNHDLVKGKYGEELFEQLFGPTYYSFEKGPVHFVVTPMWSGDYAPSYTKDQVIQWLKKDLAIKDPSKALVFINHDFSIGKDFVLKGKTEEIDLKTFNLKAWLFGHWHNNYSFVDAASGVHVISTNAPDKGGIDHSVGQFLHIQMDRNGVKSIRPIYSNLIDYIELSEPVIYGANVQINANVYDSERIAAEVSLIGYDKKGNQMLKKGLIGNGTWTWTNIIPLNVAKKVQELLVEVKYQDGSTTLQKSNFDVTTKSPLQTLWSNNVGGGIWKVSPVLIDNKLITATFDDTGSGKSKIIALNADNGAEIWSFPVKNSIKQKLNIHKDLLLATDAEGQVYAIDCKTGKIKWTKALREVGLPNYVTGSVLKDGIYYTGAGNFLTALNADNGEIIWKNTDWNGGEAMPGEMLATEDQLLTGANWNALFVHDRQTGKLLWKKNDEGARFRSGGVSADGNKIYATGLDALFILDKTNGKVINKKNHNLDFKVMGSPLIIGNQFITGTSLNGVCAFDKETLDENWRFDTRAALIFTSSYSNPNAINHVGTVESSIIPYAENLVFGASDGYLYILDQKGKLVAEKKIGAPVLADPTIHGDLIFVADFAGNIHCLRYIK